jgi:23S rRNA (cytidine1920-2'-O)/16S rRNA (cytidine1409-2'-O)-methyltransferase
VNKNKISLIDLLCLQFPEIPKKELFARILCGEVIINDEKITDPRRPVNSKSRIEFKTKQYVSRGGHKLEPILYQWNIPVKERGFIDAGASTGGFTDCLLQHGATYVYAVDVGYNQLSYSLRINPRVFVRERTNVMDIEPSCLDPKPYGAVCDLSFRSIHGAASHLLHLVSGDFLVALVKPQFEWEDPDPSFHGVIRDVHIIPHICYQLILKLKRDNVFVSRVALSPIPGTKGNTELFFLLKKNKCETIETIMTKIMSLFPK